MNRDNYTLMGAPSYKFNNELDSIINNCWFCHVCDKAEHSFVNEYGLKILCYYFARNLQTIHYDYTSDIQLKNKVCNDLLYWLQNNLKILLEKRNSDYSSVLNKFQKIWRSIIESNTFISQDKFCGSSFNEILSYDECAKTKNVSNYCENYEFIKQELNKKTETCGGFYQYLTKNSDIYKIIPSECTANGKNYCLKYSNCNTYDPKKLLSNDKCKLIEENLQLRTKKQKEEENSTLCTPGFECVSIDFIKTSINISDNRFISLIVLSVWAILLSLYFLYKLTPFRSLLNNVLYKKNIIKKNLNNEEYDDVLESDLEDSSINFNNREYIITYNHE
ncbi:PIR Superfamily Protein [Plasmodium ovale curtisi]|uniref:PIR Superfamily Protein n=1 Tax=Plasmodium ovale curtisi TaxID=864141 RepID=A0A1A8WIW5_PLAOA|nr:PIR Superfamily Protein [Plasmodium ovale curtisi]